MRLSIKFVLVSLVLFWFSCKSTDRAISSEIIFSECDSLYFLAPNVQVIVNDYSNIESRKNETELKLATSIRTEILDLLKEKYVLEYSEYSAKLDLNIDLDSLIRIDSPAIPDTLGKLINKLNYRYFLLWVTDAHKDELNFFIDNNQLNNFTTNNYLAILDKTTGKILYIESQKKKYDFNQFESIRQSVMKLIKPVYYKRIINCK